jgi:hypothetical protein
MRRKTAMRGDKLDVHEKTAQLAIAQLLLAHGADPDFRLHHHDSTPLECTIYNQDQECAHLLLWYNANTEKPGIYWEDLSIKPVREMEPTGWLQEMIDEKQRIINNCWLFKSHNFGTATLLMEIIELIRYDIWQLCIHQPIAQEKTT